MSQARGDSVLKVTANRETLTPRASQQAEFARTVEIGHFFFTTESVRDGKEPHSVIQRVLRAKEFSNFRITCNSYRSREGRASDRNRSIRVCRIVGQTNTSTVTTTRTFEVLGAYLTRS